MHIATLDLIPSAVNFIKDLTFSGCSSLTSVVFRDEIISTESMQDWWNQGVHEKSVCTYCFLVKFSTPKLLDLHMLTEWQTDIHGMLRCIPSSPQGYGFII